ncbi:MAG: MotA/TolQ/ExbB proton channel family protein [Pseudomonadota bacterium]
MDRATIIGIISAFALVVIAISNGGNLGMFWDLPSLLIVMGGTLGVTLINYPLRDLLKLVAVTRHVFVEGLRSTPHIIYQFVELAHQARKDGILSLEPAVHSLDDPFMAKGLQMTIDGVELTTVKEILETEIDNVMERHRLGADIFTSMGTFAPALGMIGTLIGLVQMLRTMNDPASIGPAMSLAIITTFYGAVLANMLFLPMGGKLRARSAEEVLLKELMLHGVLGIARGDNPRVLEQKLLSFVPASLRVSAFD